MAEKEAIAILLSIGEQADQEYVLISKSEIMEKVSGVDKSNIDIDANIEFLKEKKYIIVKYCDSDSYFLSVTETGFAKISEIRAIIEARREAARQRKEAERLREEELRLAQERHRLLLRRRQSDVQNIITDNGDTDIVPDSFECQPEYTDTCLPVQAENKRSNNKSNILISLGSGFAGGLIGGIIVFLITLLL